MVTLCSVCAYIAYKRVCAEKGAKADDHVEWQARLVVGLLRMARKAREEESASAAAEAEAHAGRPQAGCRAQQLARGGASPTPMLALEGLLGAARYFCAHAA